MVLMGDEVRRSQGGNNNAWCQNNPIGWMHWQPDDGDLALRLFLQRLLRLRQHLAALINPALPHCIASPLWRLEPGQMRLEWHGVQLDRPDWASWSHSLAWSLSDDRSGPLLWWGMNAYHQAMHFELPACTPGWLSVINTALAAGDDLPSQPGPWSEPATVVESRSLVLLAAAPLLEGVSL